MNNNIKIFKLAEFQSFCKNLHGGSHRKNENTEASKQIVDIFNLKIVSQTKVCLKFGRGHYFLIKNQLFKGKTIFFLIIFFFQILNRNI